MTLTASCAFDDIEHVSIEMPDGVRLAARLWLPHGAAEAPVPAIFEIIPYRKGDMVRARDERNHPYFAAHGYACLRVDMRGSGDSEGLMGDMYEPNELADTRHVIEWIASQPWCTGRVGMFGTSWGGTAGLQASVDAPEALKAVIAVCATHDRYEDDIHHMGGCLLTDSIEWGATLPAILASPPCAETVGPQWWEMWQERLEHLAFPLEAWMREEARGAYWRHGSARFNADRISAPILAIGGWSDRYSNSVMSLAAARPDQVWGIVGPWSHHYPDVGDPGPAMDFQKVALEWWDHWLKAPEPEVPAWPKLRVWLREYDEPAYAIVRRNGRWIQSEPAEQQWQAHLSDGALIEDVPADQKSAEVAVPHDLRVGQCAGDTGYFGRYGGLPLDQGADDAHALCYETPALSEDVNLYGAAEVMLRVSADAPRAQLGLRLSDVAPDGTVCRVAFAIRNLALDDMLDGAPDTQIAVIRFHTTAYRFKAGHKIRLSLAGSYWPLVWPAPQASEISLREGASTLSLPVLTGAPDAQLPEPDEKAQPVLHTVLEAQPLERSIDEAEDGSLISSWHQPSTRVKHHATNSTFGYETSAHHQVHKDDPLSARSRFDHSMEFERPDGVARVRSFAEVRCDAESFHVSGEVRVSWNDEEIFVRQWAPSIKRRWS
ncbi:MAG: CocE/NonD family hydrolase [Pseudomonadota bacterium]